MMTKLKIQKPERSLSINNKSDYCYFKTRNYLPEFVTYKYVFFTLTRKIKNKWVHDVIKNIFFIQ